MNEKFVTYITAIRSRCKPIILPFFAIFFVISLELLKNYDLGFYYYLLILAVLTLIGTVFKKDRIATSILLTVCLIKEPHLTHYQAIRNELPKKLYLEPISVRGKIVNNIPASSAGSNEIKIRGQLGSIKKVQDIIIYKTNRTGESINKDEFINCKLDSSNLKSFNTSLDGILDVYKSNTPFRFFLNNKTNEHYCLSPTSTKDEKRDVLIRSLDSNSRASLFLLYASCLGEGGQLETWIIDLFKNTGLYHLLVVSGFHLGLLLILSHYITGLLIHFYPRILFSLPKSTVKSIIGIGLTIFFLLVCETGKPLIRSAIVAFCMAFSVIFNRRQNIFIGLSWSLVLLSLLYPLCIFEAGVQLSYGAILGVLLGSRYANRFKKQDLETEVLSSLKLPTSYKEKFKQFIIQSFFSSLGAFIFVSPIQYYWFQTFSLWSLPFNILFGAAFSYLVVLPGFFILAALWMNPEVGIFILKIYSPVIEMNIKSINYLWELL